MNEKTFVYIFNDAKPAMAAIRRAQLKTKRTVAFSLLVTALYLAAFKVQIEAQNIKINKLAKEIEELKTEKGE